MCFSLQCRVTAGSIRVFFDQTLYKVFKNSVNYRYGWIEAAASSPLHLHMLHMQIKGRPSFLTSDTKLKILVLRSSSRGPEGSGSHNSPPCCGIFHSPPMSSFCTGRNRETDPRHPFLLLLIHFSDPSLTRSLILFGKSALLCSAADSIFLFHSYVQF